MMHLPLVLRVLALSALLANIVSGYTSTVRMQGSGTKNRYQHMPQAYDVDRVRRGQRFFQENAVGLHAAWLITLAAGFTDPLTVNALLFTKASDTPDKAQARYLRTTRDLFAWHMTDIFDPDSLGYQRLQAVKSMHSAAATRISKTGKSLDGGSKKCPFANVAREIVKPKTLTDANPDGDAEFAQFIMATAQTGFAGTFLVDPEFFGVFDTTGLDDFIYLWYVLGRELGIDDANNVCQSADTTLAAAKKLYAGLKFDNIIKDPNCAKLMDAFCEGYSFGVPAQTKTLPPFLSTFRSKLFTKEHLMMWVEERGASIGIARKNDWSARMKPLERLGAKQMEGTMKKIGKMPSLHRRLIGKAYLGGFLAFMEKKK